MKLDYKRLRLKFAILVVKNSINYIPHRCFIRSSHNSRWHLLNIFHLHPFNCRPLYLASSITAASMLQPTWMQLCQLSIVIKSNHHAQFPTTEDYLLNKLLRFLYAECLQSSTQFSSEKITKLIKRSPLSVKKKSKSLIERMMHVVLISSCPVAFPAPVDSVCNK